MIAEQLKHDPDGSLDLYIRHDSPGADREANGLLPLAGRFILMQRFCWPQAFLLNGVWKPPAVQII